MKLSPLIQICMSGSDSIGQPGAVWNSVMSKQNKQKAKAVVAKKFTAERIARRAEEKEKLDRQEALRKASTESSDA